MVPLFDDISQAFWVCVYCCIVCCRQLLVPDQSQQGQRQGQNLDQSRPEIRYSCVKSSVLFILKFRQTINTHVVSTKSIALCGFVSVCEMERLKHRFFCSA